MFIEDITKELEKALSYKLNYGGVDVVPATHIEKILRLLEEYKTKGSE